jgi:hypothetical protein
MHVQNVDIKFLSKESRWEWWRPVCQGRGDVGLSQLVVPLVVAFPLCLSGYGYSVYTALQRLSSFEKGY